MISAVLSFDASSTTRISMFSKVCACKAANKVFRVCSALEIARQTDTLGLAALELAINVLPIVLSGLGDWSCCVLSGRENELAPDAVELLVRRFLLLRKRTTS